MKIVTLIPYRKADPARERAWEIARVYYETWPWPYYLGDGDGEEFQRSAAINDASRRAGDWDIAVIADADTVQEFRPVERALEMVHETSVVPWETRYKLSRAGTDKLAMYGYDVCGLNDLDIEDGFAHPNRLRGYPPTRTGSTIVVSRAAWERATGFDESYTGWGYEDQDFRVKIGQLTSISGRIWHLWHPLAPRDARTKANGRRFRAVRASLT